MALVHFEVQRSGDYANGRAFGAVGGYRQIDGIAHFAVDPSDPKNQVIVDLPLAPRAADGRVHFQSDFSVVMPVDPDRGNQTAVVELPNRGRRRVVPMLNRVPASAPVRREADCGDGFLFTHGFTVVSLGWQWDVHRTEDMMGLQAPLAERDGVPIGGQTVVDIRPGTAASDWLLADRNHITLPAAAGAEATAVLLRRDYEDGTDTEIPAAHWRFATTSATGSSVPSRCHVQIDGGFTPGKIYHLVYQTDRAPIAGVGLLALRDTAAFLRAGQCTAAAIPSYQTLLAWGVSQTGRMLRHFLYLGLNCCEDGARAYDGMQPHVAGARRGAFNHRFAQPSNQTTPLWGHDFPFADMALCDPLTGRTAGLLDRQASIGMLPKIISTDTAAEYWRGDAALSHIDPAATTDLPEMPNTRRYLFAGTQHVAGYLGQSRHNASIKTTARYDLNVVDYRPLLRAAFMNLYAWVRSNKAPPASCHPRLDDGTAVSRDEVLRVFQSFPAFTPPDAARLPFVRAVDMGGEEAQGVAVYPAKEGVFYPALVAAVDDDGNERAGIKLPDIAVPVASHTGWNPRDPENGSSDQIVLMSGLSLMFAVDAAGQAAGNDGRRPLSARYRNRADYAAQAETVATQLIADGYLLAADLQIVVAAALERYDAVCNGQ